MSPCPSPGELALLGTTGLSDVDRARLESHVRDCVKCKNAVAVKVGVLPMGQPTNGSWNQETRLLPTDSGADSTPVPAVTTPTDPGEAPIPEELLNHPRYQVHGVIGRGGMGSVYKAEHRLLERLVVLKVIRPELVANSNVVKRFQREARLAARLTHPNVVTVYEAEEIGLMQLLVMEFIEGVDLAALVARRGVLPVNEACELIRQAAVGLENIHEQGLVHRDIKPQNLMVSRTRQVKILDLGLATLKGGRDGEEDGGLTKEQQFLGTLDYAAPEQWISSHDVDIRADIYSLGCTLYFLLAGQTPFPNTKYSSIMRQMWAHSQAPLPPIRDFRPDVPEEVSAILEKMLAKNPNDRYSRPIEVAEALEPFTHDCDLSKCVLSGAGRTGSHEPTVVSPSGGETQGNSPPDCPKPGWKNSKAVLVAGFGLGILFTGLMGSLFISSGKPQVEDTNPVSANRATAPGVTPNEVLVGMTGPFSGPSRDLGHQMQLGIQSYFRWINDQGGVAGRKLQLVYLDDEYEPKRALANMKELHEKRQVFACLGNVGAPSAILTVPYALDNKFLFFGGLSGAKILRKDPPDRFVFNFRPGLEEETSGALNYLLKIRKIRPDQIAVFAQNDAFGDDGFRGVVKTMRDHGRDQKDILKVTYERNTVDVKAAVQEIVRQKNIRAVVMLATHKPAASFIRQVKDARKDLLFTNVSFVGIESLGESLREAGPDYAEGVIVTQVVPPVDSSSTIVLKYRDALKAYFPAEKPSFVSLEGYIAATIFAEGLKRAGENLTTDTMIEGLESISKLDLGVGSAMNFSPSDHQASHKVWGSVLDKKGEVQLLELNE